MKYRVYNEKNINKNDGKIFPTYFKTKKEATAYANQIGGNATVERKVVTSWVAC